MRMEHIILGKIILKIYQEVYHDDREIYGLIATVVRVMTAIVDAVWLCEPHGLSNLLPSALEASVHFLNSTSAECRLFNANAVGSNALCTLV